MYDSSRLHMTTSRHSNSNTSYICYGEGLDWVRLIMYDWSRLHMTTSRHSKSITSNICYVERKEA